jgi:hypothetical protein
MAGVAEEDELAAVLELWHEARRQWLEAPPDSPDRKGWFTEMRSLGRECLRLKAELADNGSATAEKRQR